MSTLLRKPVASVIPRLAATAIVVRDGSLGLEVLMVRRSMHASFMPGAYVFPGGAVDMADSSPASALLCDEGALGVERRIGEVTRLGAQATAYAVAALRECFEECGLWLGVKADGSTLEVLRTQLRRGAPFATVATEAKLPLATSALHPWARWVTPVGIPKRFDTLFVVALAPPGQVPTVDEGETIQLVWVSPDRALVAQRDGEFQMEFATRSIVASLVPFDDAQQLCRHAAELQHLAVVSPRVTVDEMGIISGVVMPDDPGYDVAWTGEPP